MTTSTLRRISELATQLSEALMTAALCADELRAVVRNEDNGHVWASSNGPLAASDPTRNQRPILDESTMRVMWRGHSVHLGHTVAFRFLQRIARCPNQYVDHLTLLHDVWENEELAIATMRSLVRNLRRKLIDGGMQELAEAIRGHNGRYILELV
jgi:DNA-binding response OmpR family regulator